MKKRTQSLLMGAALGVLVPTAVGCTVAGHRVTLPAPATTTPACVPNASAGGVDTFGPNAVQVKWENELGCDLVPPQTLTIVIDAQSWAAHTGSADGWGGDASLAWADQELNDSGCRVTFHDGDWAEGSTCDY